MCFIVTPAKQADHEVDIRGYDMHLMCEREKNYIHILNKNTILHLPMKGAVWFVCIEPYLNFVRLTSFNIFLCLQSLMVTFSKTLPFQTAKSPV